jgi:hypothetical protein
MFHIVLEARNTLYSVCERVSKLHAGGREISLFEGKHRAPTIDDFLDTRCDYSQISISPSLLPFLTDHIQHVLVSDLRYRCRGT